MTRVHRAHVAASCELELTGLPQRALGPAHTLCGPCVRHFRRSVRRSKPSTGRFRKTRRTPAHPLCGRAFGTFAGPYGARNRPLDGFARRAAHLLTRSAGRAFGTFAGPYGARNRPLDGFARRAAHLLTRSAGRASPWRGPKAARRRPRVRARRQAPPSPPKNRQRPGASVPGHRARKSRRRQCLLR